MDGNTRGGRVRSFVLGGVLGASAAVATARRRRELARRRRTRMEHPPGLRAFEGAPCYLELVRDEDRESAEHAVDGGADARAAVHSAGDA
jgi:hypothetical protein